MSQSLFLGITIGAALQSGFQSTFGKAGQQAIKLGDSLKKMGHQRQLIKTFQKNEAAVKNTRLELSKAQKQLQRVKLEYKNIEQQAKKTGDSTQNAGNKITNTLTWNEFTGQRMSKYMKELGGHGPAIKKIAEEWKEYKKQNTSALKSTSKSTKTAQDTLKKLKKQLESAKNEVNSLDKKLIKQRNTLQQSRAAMHKAGVAIGNYSRQFFQLGKNIDRAQYKMRRFNVLAKKQQQIQNRRAELQGKAVGMIGAAYSVFAPVSTAIEFEKKLRLFGNIANLTSSQLKNIKSQLNDIATATHQQPGQLLEALDFLVGKGIAPDVALKALNSIGQAATATGADMGDLAKTAFAAIDTMGIAASDIGKVMDTLAESGKQGGFELRDMARQFPMLTAQAKALGIQGRQGIALLGSALQIAVKGANDADQAANNFNNFLTKMTAPETVRNFKKAGFDLKQVIAQGMAQGKNPINIMLEQIQRMTGGDKFKIGELFGDMQVIQFLNPLLANMKEFDRINRQSARAKGVISKDFANMANTSADQINQLSISLGKVGDALAVTVLPGINRVAKGAAWLSEKVYFLAQTFPMLTTGLSTAAVGLVGVKLLAFGAGYASTFLSGTLLAAQKANIAFGLTTKAVTAAQWLWNAALTANPIGLVIAGVAAFGALAYTVYKKWAPIKQFFKDLWGTVGQVVSSVTSFFGSEQHSPPQGSRKSRRQARAAAVISGAMAATPATVASAPTQINNTMHITQMAGEDTEALARRIVEIQRETQLREEADVR